MHTPQERLLIDMRVTPEWDTCFDSHAPFDVRHVGKLATPRHLQDTEVPTLTPPRNHCVVEAGNQPALAVLRFTPFTYNKVPDADSLADIHEKHLAKLGELGLQPWLTEMSTGTHPTALTGGLYILQNLLPKEARIGLYSFDDCNTMTQRVAQYHVWAKDTNQPVYLMDLTRPDQYSIVDGEIVLHDVEPLYSTVFE